MGKIYDRIDDALRSFLAAQHVFFVATAPNERDGHVNCSPKGLNAFRVIGDTIVAYADYTGSGVETIAHLRQNGRIVLLFNAFEGPPKIVRLHGRGSVVEPSDAEYAALHAHFADLPELGLRAIIRVDVTRISDSCGHGVPLYRYEGERDQIPRWAERKGADGMAEYRRAMNASSIDGLAGLS